ncbi:MAG: hypothetical protein M0Q24_10615 [Sulfurimonas sp.]|uniref:hypothetical protein n=1 Tax=Sulfurimonas sp. TaxID=2022749 RepID=UPI0025D177DD|nr:hypothetical protein [Sulfurimonas sp.]MCK9492530.1 hypothetical protein [Sulfurimonas sp.]
MFKTIKTRLNFVSGYIDNQKYNQEKKDFLSLYTYTNFPDNLTAININTSNFHRNCIIYRNYADEQNESFINKAYIRKRETGEFICSLKTLHDAKQIELKAEVQNIMSSIEAHNKEFTLKSYMLTLTLSSEELKKLESKMSFLEHSKMIYEQVSTLRYFMKLLYSDRLTKYRMDNFFWMRMLEFTKIGNAHLHEALYIKEKNLLDMINLIGRKLLDFPLLGRTHLTVDSKSWGKISNELKYKKISKNEYLLLSYSHENFFDKGHENAGKGFIIRVLTLKKETKEQSKSSVSRYIMKYLLKTRSNDETKFGLQRAVFSFLRINPFSFKRGVLFPLTKFRAIKSKLIKEKVISKSDKHSLYTLAKMQRTGVLKVKAKYEFKSFNEFIWKASKWDFTEFPKNLLGFNFNNFQGYLLPGREYNFDYWKEFFTIKVLEVFYRKKLFKIYLEAQYEVLTE